MGIETLIGGIMYLASTLINTGSIDAKTVWNTAIMLDKVNQKTKQGTWGASAHEESHQAVKDAVLDMGKN
jgi:hypothetical protein